MNEFIERDGPPSDCPDCLKEWYYNRLNENQHRVEFSCRVYDDYYEVNKIPEKDRWKVNLRKEIAYLKKINKI